MVRPIAESVRSREVGHAHAFYGFALPGVEGGRFQAAVRVKPELRPRHSQVSTSWSRIAARRGRRACAATTHRPRRLWVTGAVATGPANRYAANCPRTTKRSERVTVGGARSAAWSGGTCCSIRSAQCHTRQPGAHLGATQVASRVPTSAGHQLAHIQTLRWSAGGTRVMRCRTPVILRSASSSLPRDFPGGVYAARSWR